MPEQPGSTVAPCGEALHIRRDFDYKTHRCVRVAPHSGLHEDEDGVGWLAAPAGGSDA